MGRAPPQLGAIGVAAQEMQSAWFATQLDPARAYVIPPLPSRLKSKCLPLYRSRVRRPRIAAPRAVPT